MNVQTPSIMHTSVGLTSIIILLLTHVNGQGPAIDQNHQDKVGNCGVMPIISQTRLINSEESKVHYPWVISVIRYYKEEIVESCGGTIITKRFEK